MNGTEAPHIERNKLDSDSYHLFYPMKQRTKRPLERRSLIGREGE